MKCGSSQLQLSRIRLYVSSILSFAKIPEVEVSDSVVNVSNIFEGIDNGAEVVTFPTAHFQANLANRLGSMLDSSLFSTYFLRSAQFDFVSIL